jgi:7-cyano-7-deazaguanine synthase
MTVEFSNAGAVGLLLSGGLDSGILLAHLAKNRRVRPFYVRCGLAWEEAELRAVRALLEALREKCLPEPLVILEMPLGDLYGDHWSVSGRDAPDAGSPEEAVYLPGRNALLTLKPALWCAMHGIEELALAVLASNPFADATDEFFREFAGAIERATGSRLRFTRPFARFHKQAVMELGQGLPLELTFSCIVPVGGLHCGRCNKCAERMLAFRSVGVDDPTLYVNKSVNMMEGEG